MNRFKRVIKNQKLFPHILIVVEFITQYIEKPNYYCKIVIKIYGYLNKLTK